MSTEIYIQLLQSTTIEGLTFPIGTILSMVDVYSKKPVIEVNGRKHVLFKKSRYLSMRECKLYQQDIIILRSIKICSACGKYKTTLEPGERLFIDGFTLAGEAYTMIDSIQYNIEDSYYMLYKDFMDRFVTACQDVLFTKQTRLLLS